MSFCRWTRQAVLLAAGGAALAAGGAVAGGLTQPLYRFTGGADGAFPSAGVTIGGDGTLYGTAIDGGSTDGVCAQNTPAGCGVVFMLTPPPSGAGGWSETVLYMFSGDVDGALPEGGLIFGADGALYGTAINGGDLSCGFKGCGVVFKLVPNPDGSGWTEVVLHMFRGGRDGAGPFGGLALGQDGAVYGATINGGDSGGACAASSGCGVVFKLTPPPPGGRRWTETVLRRFRDFGGGAFPEGGVILARRGDGVLGTTTSGGDLTCGSSGCGVVFKLLPPNAGQNEWTEIVLHTFSGADGAGPRSVVLSDDGTLYGTTENGGDGCRLGDACGVVFALTPPMAGQPFWAQSVLYSFTGGADGSSPLGGVTLGPDGVIYGTASEGGNRCDGGHRCGVVFALAPPSADATTWTQTVLHRFTGKQAGAFPNNVVLGADGALYGTTTGGGGNPSICSRHIGCGMVFRLTP